ncbi:amidohydrolase family protein [Pedobacter sp. LMG 31464]|uniref:Amidohydrolase family protein n=1 Tax=Pedobacter planticolens TaxID=2679964 RepID=A0A923IUY6_9SPHI|nr:amidohydrolase family protein [Pedobacter planticolens]MBB2144644.1 amidohydrolase family protein [Pedobacter planticolens]
MILKDVILVENSQKASIQIKDGKISAVLMGEFNANDEPQLNFEDAIAFPGLINSHDHLDFNLFPQFGEKLYQNYTEWGKQIHQDYPNEIAAILKIPKSLREHWGIYKNLICGVTTVVNHGPKVQPSEKLIKVLEGGQNLHSVQFDKWWKVKLNNPFKAHKNVVIHVGEGVDESAKKEIDTLIKWNLLKRNLIGIHGVAMNPQHFLDFKALIWCPQSNYFLLNTTARINLIKKFRPVLFGTDSTLTSNWNIWDHLDFARKLKMLSDQELYHTLNSNPAKIWQQLSGTLEKGYVADIVIAKRKNNPDAFDAFFKTQPADLLLVMSKGKIILFDESLVPQLENLVNTNYQKIRVNGSLKYVFGNLHELIAQIKHYQPSAQFPIEIIPS